MSPSCRLSSPVPGPQRPQGPQGPAGISAGYSALVAPGSDMPLSDTAGVVAQTNTIATSGTYFISASAMPFVSSDGTFAFCFDTLASSGTASQYGGAFATGNYVSASISDVLFVEAGDSVQLLCYASGSSSEAFDAGITATLINRPDAAKKKHSRHRHEAPGTAPVSLELVSQRRTYTMGAPPRPFNWVAYLSALTRESFFTF